MEYKTLNCHPQTYYILKRVAELRRWEMTTFLQFLAELFSNSLDGITDPDLDINVLRELYSNWQLGIYPHGSPEMLERRGI